MATGMVRLLRARGVHVLAIDADHNMDLSYNLGADPSLFLGTDPDLIKEYLGTARSGTFAEALQHGRGRGTAFTLHPADAFTARASVELEEGLRLMTAGPHTDRVRTQEACSHSLAAPLKAYLPLLQLRKDEAVVIDERAGTDPVATGILAGIDLAVVVREPTVNSQRVAEQIARELTIASVPFVLADNKLSGIEQDVSRMCEMVLNRPRASV
jgi:CO dehydrogenase nickel-insertion accessory protein CooC1